MEDGTGKGLAFTEEVEEIGVSLLEAICVLQNARIVAEADGMGWEIIRTFSVAEKILKGARERLERLGRPMGP